MWSKTTNIFKYMLKKIPFILILIFVACNSTTAQQFRPSADGIKFERTLQLISNLYVDDVDTRALTEAAIRAMLRELDPHSSYLDAQEVRAMNEPLQGNFDGIGISFNMLTDTLYVLEVISGGPSQQVGLMPGDRIIFVNDTLISGVQMNQQDVVRRLRGPAGTTVDIKVRRRGVPELLDFHIVRGRIPIFSVEAAYMVTNDIGYIRISRFGATTTEEFKRAERELKAQGMKNLILDLTGNGGGILHTAAEISSEFLGDNKLIVYTEGRNQPRLTMNSTPGGEMLEGRVVVLVDEGSASASEILAGALQDWDRGIIVGRRTFGKGTVQRQIPLPPDNATMIRLTVARYYTPSGRSIQKPYEEGNAEAYNQDIVNRFLHGELVNADSIHFPDSLKFRTLVNGRTVFGGGGITPDYFVPIDTTASTRLHLQLFTRGVINRTAMSEVDENRAELLRRFPNITAFQNNFQVPQSMFDRMKRMAESDNIEWDNEQFEQSRSFITRQIRTTMARDLYDSSASFQIWNEGADIFQEGLRIISNPERYENLLRGIGSNIGVKN
ncbi:MAG: S41 family peptidase [Dysgonamonadaceae bacterium]|jgi:carboxyl-terminal processing protease|nr:S41 family peptidase [Dysgonamonadaceae bacterium]